MEFEQGEIVIYQSGNRYELGEIKRKCADGTHYFVLYSTGHTAARTSVDNLHKIDNGYAYYITRKDCGVA